MLPGFPSSSSIQRALGAPEVRISLHRWREKRSPAPVPASTGCFMLTRIIGFVIFATRSGVAEDVHVAYEMRMPSFGNSHLHDATPLKCSKCTHTITRRALILGRIFGAPETDGGRTFFWKGSSSSSCTQHNRPTLP